MVDSKERREDLKDARFGKPGSRRDESSKIRNAAGSSGQAPKCRHAQRMRGGDEAEAVDDKTGRNRKVAIETDIRHRNSDQNGPELPELHHMGCMSL